MRRSRSLSDVLRARYGSSMDPDTRLFVDEMTAVLAVRARQCAAAPPTHAMHDHSNSAPSVYVGAEPWGTRAGAATLLEPAASSAGGRLAPGGGAEDVGA